MGSKGSNTTTTNQTQTYNPAGAGYVQNALQQGQNAASLPFNIPQAPVAGFSQDQQNAFNTVNNAQGMAQPYFNQANQYFQQSAQGPNVSQFFNPYASAVTSQLNNIFGQQASQNTGQLTQAAGGVGADRIAVGQANLANQQGLAAGQTLAGLYAPSLQAAQNQQNILQSAGYGTAALGSQAQNAALSGAQAQLGTGGLQQQLQQAQLNAPYQQQLAQAAFPYQQAQFLAGITGALAPGLGGTTTGQGQTTTPTPSLWSQLLGGGTAAAGLLGQTGAFGNSGWLSGSNGIFGSGSGGGSNYASQPLTGADAWQNSQLFPGYGSATAQGGAVYPYAEGGSVSDEPIDVAPQSIIPTGAQTPHIQDHIPQLNLNPPQQQQSGGGGGGGLGDVMKIAAMFMARGGAASPYADGGATAYPGTDDNMMFASGPNERMIRAKRDLRIGLQDKTAQPIAMGAARNQADEIMGFRPRGYADGGGTDDVINPDEPFRMPGQDAMDDWRKSVDHNIAAGQTGTGAEHEPLAFNAPDSTGVAFPPPSGSHGRSVSGAMVEPAAAPEASPYAAPAAAAQSDDGTGGFNKFIKSPWAALTAAGLGIMGGTSPYAGVNIGQGAMQGLKLLEEQRGASQKDETIAQAAKRLELEAKHHEDQYTRMNPYQRESVAVAKQKEALEAAKPFKIGTDKNGFDIMGVRDPAHPGQFINATTGKPVDSGTVDPDLKRGPDAKVTPTADGILNAHAEVMATPYDYTTDAPYIEKGMDVPEPETVAGRSARSVQTDAEYYLQTGKLPPVARGKNPTAIAQQNYRNAVQNYGNAVAQSRGLAPEQMADMWRTAPGMLRFVLGPDGRSTVALGTAVRHLDTLQELSKAWQAGDVAAIGRLRAIVSREFGAEAATNLQAAGRIIGPEIIKALGVAGAGTSEERGAAAQGFSTSASPAQMAGAIRTTQSLLGGQLEGRKRQAANAGVSEDRFKSLIGERPYEILSHSIAAPGAAPAATRAPAAAPAVSPPSAAAAPAPAPTPGTTVKQNGHTYERQPDGSYKAID